MALALGAAAETDDAPLTHLPLTCRAGWSQPAAQHLGAATPQNLARAMLS